MGDSLGLVIDLQVGGMLYVIFSPSGAPYTIHSLPLISFQVTQSLHCTQGVVITGAAEIGQDKGMLPAQDVFPPFFSISFFALLSCFPFSSHVGQFFLLPSLIAHFSLMLVPCWLISSPYILFPFEAGCFKMEKQVTPMIVWLLFFALIETRFCPLQLPQSLGSQPKTLTHVWL